MTYQQLKSRVYTTVQKAEPGDKLSAYFDTFIIALIIINAASILVETVESIHHAYEPLFDYFELFVVVVFSIEYVLRVWSITEEESYQHPVFGRLRYMVSFESLIDLAAILPFFLPYFLKVDARLSQGLRLLRLLRTFKLARYSSGVHMVQRVISSRRDELVITFGTVIIMLIISSTLMYFIESGAQPDTFSSIPSTMWWGVATLTTVGYGDVYPITPFGKLLGAFIAILGIGVFALPAGIIASGFEQELSERKKQKRQEPEEEEPVAGPNYCPHCGKPWHQHAKD